MDPLKEYLMNKAYPGRWIYPSEVKSDLSPVKRATEIIREKVFRLANQEIPYTSSIKIIGWTKTPDDVLRIDASIYVPKRPQIQILIGTKGEKIKRIASDSESELSKILNEKVRVVVSVKHRKFPPVKPI